MTTKTRKTSEPTPPPTFADIARKKIRSHLETYRALLRRHADGELLSEDDLSTVADTLEALGLPDWCWPRDLEGLRRFALAQAKFQAAVDAVPANQQRVQELRKEIDSVRARLAVLLEEQRKADGATGKPAAYEATVKQLEMDHPQALAPLDVATELRLEELNRRKREGVA